MRPEVTTAPDFEGAGSQAEPDPAGTGPSGGTPFTVYFPTDDGYRAADLAHPAPLPHVGDRVDYLDEDGMSHRYRVREVVHTLQVAPAYRPRSRETGAPGVTADSDEDGARMVPEGSELRGGLPEVFLEALPEGGGDAP